MTSLLLPIHLDDLDALDPARLHPSFQYLKYAKPLVLNSTKKAPDFQNERMNRRQMNRHFRAKSGYRSKLANRNLNSLNLENRDSKNSDEKTDFKIDQRSDNKYNNKSLETRSTLIQYTTSKREPSISLGLALLPLLIWQLLAIAGGAIGAVSFWKHEKAKREGIRARSPPVPVDSASILPDFVNRRRQAAIENNAAENTETVMLNDEMPPNLTVTQESPVRVTTRRRRSHPTNSQIDFYIMAIHCITILAMLATEVQVFIKCSATSNSYPWVIAMAPMLLLTPLGILATVWAFRRSKVLELEPILATFSIQLLFIALKLDNIINWSWFVVAIPSWVIILVIVTCLAAMLCHIAVSYVRTRNNAHHAGLFGGEFGSQGAVSGYQYLKPAQYLSSIMLVLIPIMLFLIMLVVRLDTPEMRLPWRIVFAPFNISVLLLLLLNCCMPNSSRWWFGIKDDYCKFVFVKFPEMRTFANCAIYVSEAPEHLPAVPTSVVTRPASNNANARTPTTATATTYNSSLPVVSTSQRLWNRNNKRDEQNSGGENSSCDKIPVKFDLFSPD